MCADYRPARGLVASYQIVESAIKKGISFWWAINSLNDTKRS